MLLNTEPTAGLVLRALGLAPEKIPRLRDAYITWLDETRNRPVFVIYTRTGGGNRDFYESLKNRETYYPKEDFQGPFNEDLRKVQGYIWDEDDSFDNTYAYFYFDIPKDSFITEKQIIDYLTVKGEPMTPTEKFKRRIEALNKNESDIPK